MRIPFITWQSLVFCLASTAIASAQTTEYLVKGKPVTKQTYEAVILVNEAIPLINSKNYLQAEDKLTKAIELVPSLSEAQYNLGLILARQGKSDAAIEHLQTVITSHADLPLAWVMLAGIYQNAGNFSQAVSIYQDALKIFPEKTWVSSPEIHYNYGLALARVGKLDEASHELRLSIPIKADLPGLWLSLGAVYQAAGRLTDSIAAYKEFLRRFAGHNEAPRVAGAIKLMERELKRADGANNSSSDYFVEISRAGIKRWSSSQMPLKVYLSSGQGVMGFKPSYQLLLKQSFQDWLNVSQDKIRIEYIDELGKADITCYWTNDPQKLANRAEGGEAKLLINNNDGTIAKATIQILTVPITPLRPITDNLIRFVCLHEIGHALGISGHSSIPGDIMYFSSNLSDESLRLSARDIRTLQCLYDIQIKSTP